MAKATARSHGVGGNVRPGKGLDAFVVTGVVAGFLVRLRVGIEDVAALAGLFVRRRTLVERVDDGSFLAS